MQIDLFNAMTLVGKLPSSTAKTALVARIDAAQIITTLNFQASIISSATVLVVKAESSQLQADVTSALNTAKQLPSRTARTGLLSRLTTLQAIVTSNNRLLQSLLQPRKLLRLRQVSCSRMQQLQIN